MGTRQWALILLVVVLAIAAYLLMRPAGNSGSGSGQPAPHAIDQSQ